MYFGIAKGNVVIGKRIRSYGMEPYRSTFILPALSASAKDSQDSTGHLYEEERKAAVNM